MTRSQLITEIAEMGMSRTQAKWFCNEVFAMIKEALMRGEQVQIVGFGTFSVKERLPRKGMNPRTKETIDLPATKHVHFTQSKSFKGLLKC